MMNEMYRQLGVSQAVYEFGEATLGGLTERFREIDAVAEYNQCKVLAAMQKNRVNATHFAATTGYGYDDEGRDNLSGSMPTASTRRQPWCGPRSPAVPMPSPWPSVPIYGPETSF